MGLTRGVRVLGIDTATAIASVGCVDEQGQGSERALPIAGSHARTLLPLIDAVLRDAGRRLADLDLLAVSIGPGSFTGLRIGLAVAKGLALATALPLIGVPTLEAYAHALGCRSGAVWPVLDARKGEVYAAAFHWEEDVLCSDRSATALDPEALAAALVAPCTLLGDGVDAYAGLWANAADGRAECLSLRDCPPSGASVARLGARYYRAAGAAALAALEPAYCRRSEAEELRERRRGDRLSVR